MKADKSRAARAESRTKARKQVAAFDDRTKQARRVSRALARHYPNATCALHHRGPFQLLVATILSAQCTDKKVNEVTPTLFGRCPDAAKMAACDEGELEHIIRPTGFFRAKARNLRAMARELVAKHEGQVPRDLDALTALPGVGRKTAHVVLGTAYRIPSGVVVDTHVTRLAQRMGITQATDAVKIERDLLAALPRSQWIDFSHRMIAHGRQVCIARRPRCVECTLSRICPRVGVAATAV